MIRNKTFFFGAYEYTKSEKPDHARRKPFPTLLQREGDFSKTLNSSGQLMTIYNPFDTFINAAGNIERGPFPGNMIPESMMDPVALKALSLLPAPESAGHRRYATPTTGSTQGINSARATRWTLKSDHNFSDKARLTGRYSYAAAQATRRTCSAKATPPTRSTTARTRRTYTTRSWLSSPACRAPTTSGPSVTD